VELRTKEEMLERCEKYSSRGGVCARWTEWPRGGDKKALQNVMGVSTGYDSPDSGF
jgi:hypothetical protein